MAVVDALVDQLDRVSPACLGICNHMHFGGCQSATKGSTRDPDVDHLFEPAFQRSQRTRRLGRKTQDKPPDQNDDLDRPLTL